MKNYNQNVYLLMDRESKINFTYENLELLMDKKRSFSLKKKGISTTVGVIGGDVFEVHCNLLIKRFNYKGFFDKLLKILVGSRAVRLWAINQRLYEKALPVPKPIAYFEPSFKKRHSFFISIAIEKSDNLGNIYKKGLFHEPEKVASALGKTIAQWHMAGAVHGDLKWSNILMQKNNGELKFFFVDLDQAKLYSRPKIKGIIKDLVRFYRYGLELGAEEWVDSKFFPQYIAHIPSEIKVDIDLRYIKERALKDWKRKGQKRFRID